MGFFDEDTRSMLEVYLLETGQMLERLEETLLDAEKNGIFASEDIHNVFRFMHTIKGSSAMMGLTAIADTAHSLEEIFALLRESPDKMKGQEEELYNLLFKASDFFKSEMERMEADEFEPSQPGELASEIDGALKRLSREESYEPDSRDECTGDKTPGNVEDKKGVRVFFEPDCKMEHIRAYSLIRQVREEIPDAKCFPAQPERDANAEESIRNGGFCVVVGEDQVGTVLSIIKQTLFVSRCMIEDQACREEDAGDKSEAKETTEPPEPSKPQESVQVQKGKRKDGEFLNVKMERLDKLQNLTEELLILFSSLQSQMKKEEYADLREKYGYPAAQLLDELSNTVTNIRMVPVTQIVPKLRRVLRDICKKEGKQIELTVTGQEVDADKNIVEQLYEACLHIVRNSADHGIGSLEERRELGKTAGGNIEIQIENAGGKLKVRVSDDGRGMNEESLRRKAREKKLFTKPEEEYSREEIFELCTLPGFSTNETATEYSGRGVGMDIVRKIAEDCGGRLWIESEEGKGTAITMELPLARTVMDMVQFEAGGVMFAVPRSQARGFLEYDPQNPQIRQEHGRQMLLHENRLIPILDVAGFLRLKQREHERGILMMIQASSGELCLLADEVLGEEKLVLKAVPALFGPGYQRRTGISGFSVQGDGDICLAVDGGLMDQAIQREIRKKGESGND